jgi:hypothetical protein
MNSNVGRGTVDKLWQLEARLWTDADESLRILLDPDLLLVLPETSYVLQARTGAAILVDTANWRNLEIDDRHVVGINQDVILLAYQVRGVCSKTGPVAATSTSCWHRTNSDWRLVQHQRCVRQG